MTVNAVGIVSDITFKEGNSTSGKAWTKTNFKLTEFYTLGTGEVKSRTFWISSFKPITLVDGGIYLIGGELRNTQDQNGQWKLEVQANYATPYTLPQNQPATQQIQPQNNQPQYNNTYQQPQQSYPQQQYQQYPQQGYQQSYPQQGYAQQRPPVNSINGQENFTNDDIPF